MSERSRVLRGLRRTLREVSHLVRNHREPLTRFAGTGDFDRRVEREEVRLEGDLVDRADRSSTSDPTPS